MMLEHKNSPRWNKVLLDANYEQNGKTIALFWDIDEVPILRRDTLVGDPIHTSHTRGVLHHCMSYADYWQVICISNGKTEIDFPHHEDEDIAFIDDTPTFLAVLRGLVQTFDNGKKHKAVMLSIDNLWDILENAGEYQKEINELVTFLMKKGRHHQIYLSLTTDDRSPALKSA